MKTRLVLLVAGLGMMASSVPALAAQSKSLSVLAGLDNGGVAFGANFDVNDSPNEAYGGYARVFSKDKDEGAPAIFAFGAEFRGQTKIGLFEYYMAPGFGLIHHNYDETRILVGPTLAIGMTAELDKTSSLGIENTKLYSWAGHYKGLIKDAFLAQYRLNFN